MLDYMLKSLVLETNQLEHHIIIGICKECTCLVHMINFQVEQIRVPIKLNSNPTVKKDKETDE